MIYKTKGIILKRTNLNEADRILTILTSERGKIKIIAKGIRKIKSKLAGSLELFCLTDLIVAEGRNLDIVCGAEIKKSFMILRKNFGPTSSAYFLAEIIDKNLAEDQKHEEVFDLFLVCLEQLNEKNEPLILPYFQINFLADTGFLPELHQCIKCNKKITPENNHFNFDGGLTCEKCADGRPVSDETIKLLRLFLSHKLSTILTIKTSQKILSELKHIITYYYKNLHPEQINSERFVL